ncbi:MAG TPA: hypothetical protein VH575_12285 [Gemmataceae bacterium]|jgi:hypothetical protein
MTKSRFDTSSDFGANAPRKKIKKVKTVKTVEPYVNLGGCDDEAEGAGGQTDDGLRRLGVTFSTRGVTLMGYELLSHDESPLYEDGQEVAVQHTVHVCRRTA